MDKHFTVATTFALAAGLLAVNAGDALAARCTAVIGANENPPVLSDGSGRFRVNQTAGENLTYRLRYDIPNAEVIQAHIHIGNPGTNGGVAAFLCTNAGGVDAPECPTPSGLVDDALASADVLAVEGENGPIIEAGDLQGLFKLIRDGATYVNVHTTDHPTGEIRCQINARLR